MSGHSKWATTKHRKAAVDKVRAKVFAKLIRQLEVAAHEGGRGPQHQRHLAHHVREGPATRVVPMDTIERAIKRGTGELEGVHYEEVTYEGYGPGGVAIIVECLTDNRNRTGAEIRNVFTRNGGSMAEPGAVGWQFARRRDRAAPVPRRGPGSWRWPSRPGPRTSPTKATIGRDLRPRRPRRRARRPRRQPAWRRSRLGMSPWCLDHRPGERRGRGRAGPPPRSRPSTTTTTCRPCSPTSTPPSECWRPSAAEYLGPARRRCPDIHLRPGAVAKSRTLFVLGVDPGLSRCGYGLVEVRGSRPGRPAGGRHHDRARASRSKSAWPSCSTSCGPLMAEHRPTPWWWSGSSSRRTPSTAMLGGPGQRAGPARRRPRPGCEVAQYTRQRGQAGGRRLRRCHQGPGPADGGRAARPGRAAPAP